MNPYGMPLPYYGGLGQAQNSQSYMQQGPYAGGAQGAGMQQPGMGAWWQGQGQQQGPQQQMRPPPLPVQRQAAPPAAGGMAGAGMGMMYPGAGGQAGAPGMMGLSPQIIQQLMQKNLAAYKGQQQQPGPPPGAPGYTTGGVGNNVQLPQQTQQPQQPQPWGSSGAVPYGNAPYTPPGWNNDSTY